MTMARIPEGVLKGWRDNNRIEATDYVREQEIFRQAINHTQDQVDVFNNAVQELKAKIEEGSGGSGIDISQEIADALSSDGYRIKAEDGANVSGLLESTFYLTREGRVKKVMIPDGLYLIDKTIDVPEMIHLDISHNAVIQPTTGDFNIFQIRPKSRLSGGIVDLENVTFTKAVFYLDAEDVFQFYGQSHIISDINVLNKVPPVKGEFTGTGILCEAKTNMGFIDNVKFNNLTFINFEKVIHLRVDPILDEMLKTDPNAMAWVNANYFFQITAQNFSYGLYLEGKASVPRDVGGNMFDQCQFQAEETTKAIVYCEGAYNTFNIFMWDLHKMQDQNAAIQFAKSSRFNEIHTAMQLEITESWKDEGYMNKITSPGNYVPEMRTGFAQRISTPYKGQFNGNQDDYFFNGHHRGYTVTQTSGPAPVGDLIDIFTEDTELGPTWTMTPDIDYMNPITLEIDCSSDPVVYAQFVGTSHPWDMIPEGLMVEGWTGTEYIWMHEVKTNHSNDYLLSPPYSAIDNMTKVRVKFYGSLNEDKKVTIGRLLAHSSKSFGNAFISQYTDHLPMVDINGVPRKIKLNADGTWDNTSAVAPSIPPVLPGDKTVIGDQDDILLLADRRYVVNSTGAAKTSGNIADMFSLKREAFCRWTAPTTGAPIVIEIDFGTKPIQYMESLGINFGWGETAKNIKVERVLTSGGAYVQLANATSNTLSSYHIASRATNVYKIRLTISVANNANSLVRITRIFATASTTLPATFVNIEGANVVYGDLEFGDATKGNILRALDGSRWRVTVDNLGAISTTKL
jgi:hypothetical protein